jgi:hypothetical protein
MGGAVSFVAAAVAGVVSNQPGGHMGWAWVAFGIVLALGAAVTGWTAYRTTTSGTAHVGSGAVTHCDDVRVGGVSADGGQAVGVNYGSMIQMHRHDPDAPP